VRIAIYLVAAAVRVGLGLFIHLSIDSRKARRSLSLFLLSSLYILFFLNLLTNG